MTKLKIRAVGGSLGVILPKPVLQRLNVSEGDEIFLTEAPGGGYRLTAKTPDVALRLIVRMEEWLLVSFAIKSGSWSLLVKRPCAAVFFKG